MGFQAHAVQSSQPSPLSLQRLPLPPPAARDGTLEVKDEAEIDEEAAEEEVAEEEEEEFYMIKIKNMRYYVTNESNSEIYAYGKDGDLGDLVGKYVNGKPTFE